MVNVNESAGRIAALYRMDRRRHIAGMAILKIARMGHPVLKVRADEIDDPKAPEIASLVEFMLDTMADADGLGLAAPQVYVPLRLVIFRIPPPDVGYEEELDREPLSLRTLINPQIEPLSDEKTLGWEGCLSVPGLRGKVRRYTKIRYSGLSLDGTTIDDVAEGLHARVVQHECDHLDGVLYPMRMDDLSLLTFESEWKHLREAEAEAQTEEETEARAEEEAEANAGEEEEADLERAS